MTVESKEIETKYVKYSRLRIHEFENKEAGVSISHFNATKPCIHIHNNCVEIEGFDKDTNTPIDFTLYFDEKETPKISIIKGSEK